MIDKDKIKSCLAYVGEMATNNRLSVTSQVAVASWVRQYYNERKDELVSELKKCDWDLERLIPQLALDINDKVLTNINRTEAEMAEDKKWLESYEKTLKAHTDKVLSLQTRIEAIKEEKRVIGQMKAGEIDQGERLRRTNELAAKLAPLETELTSAKMMKTQYIRSNSKTADKMRNCPVTTYCAFEGNNLNKFISAIADAISSIDEYKTEPRDMEARKAFNPQKKMDLKTALFTILWNTRPQTIGFSIVSLKAWCANFMRFVKLGVRDANSPGMMTFVSRRDNGQRKGSCGKTTIVKSLLELLRRNNLNIQDYAEPISFPTKTTKDKKMSGRTLVFFDDIENDRDVGNDYEAMNQFLDGRSLRTKMKYEKEMPIFAHGYAIGTTNYDSTYENKKRYARIEFSLNDSKIFYKDEIVQNHAKFSVDEVKCVYDYTDAWETLLAYALENWKSWLDEYYSQCESFVSTQLNREHWIVLAVLDGQKGREITLKRILDVIKNEYRGELKVWDASRVKKCLDDLGFQPINRLEGNLYLHKYNIPKELPSPTSNYENAFEQVWNYIDVNVKEA